MNWFKSYLQFIPLSDPYLPKLRKRKKIVSTSKKDSETNDDDFAGARSERSTFDGMLNTSKNSHSSKPTKYAKLFVGHPVEQFSADSNRVFKFILSVQFVNEKTKGHSWFELRSEIFQNLCELIFCLFPCKAKLQLGSTDEYTEKIARTFGTRSRILSIRNDPSSVISEPRQANNKGNTFHVLQNAGICTITVDGNTDDQNIMEVIDAELDKIIDEFEKMVTDRKFRDLYRMAAWWTFCASQLDAVEVVKTIKAQKSSDLFYSCASYKGAVYPYIIRDRGHAISDDLPKSKLVVKKYASLNEIFLDEDIRSFVKELMGEYDEQFFDVVFKKNDDEDCEIDVSFLN